jgi:pimeloyl-ACP methyl ester carboxylesterase
MNDFVPITPGRRQRSLAQAAALAVAVLIALALGAPAAGAAPKPLANGVGAPIKWHECEPRGQHIQCARVRVPLDWDHPGGRTIGLALIRHLASKPNQKIGTLFVNPGGPGDSGLSLVKGAGAELDAFGGGRFDVVSWDPRGTNASTRTECFRNRRGEERFWAGVEYPEGPAQARRFVHKLAALARRCEQVSGWLLPHITTADTARDLDHLRSLMGERKLTYVGLSYGSYLGQTYANMFPNRVRAMLLEGIVDAPAYARSAEARAAAWVGGADDVFEQFLAVCRKAGPNFCALAGDKETPGERFRRLLRRLRQRPLPAPGVYPPPGTQESLHYVPFLVSQFQPMRSPSSWPQNAEALRSALEGDGTALESTARAFLTPTGWNSIITSNAIQCADAPATKGLAYWPRELRRMKQLSWLQGIVHTWWTWAPCAAWRVRGQDAYRGPWNHKTKNPILLINQTHEPNSPYANAVKAEKYLGNARLIALDGYGHLPFQDPSQCVETAQREYLVRLVVPPKDSVCHADRKPFDPEFGQPLEVEPEPTP